MLLKVRKIIPYILVSIVSVLVSVGIYYILQTQNSTKIGYIQLSTVYDSFTLSKELNAKFKNTTSMRKNYIDSLEFQVKAMYSKINSDKGNTALQENFKMAERNYLYQKQEFERTMEEVEAEYNEQIWKQLNEYIIEYGKEKNYTYIFGADGSGTLMYGKESANLTKEMIVYVNDKYQGK